MFSDDHLTGNVTRTCGLDNEWLPAKIYCMSDEISMVFAEVCLPGVNI